MNPIENSVTQQSQPLFWQGEVEDRNDPRKMGRVRVRIIGLHTPNKQLIPTEALPWSMVSYPPGSALTMMAPKVGDRVHGYFLDPTNYRHFLVVGVLSGLFLATESQDGFTGDQRPKSEKNKDPQYPQGAQMCFAGQPTFPPTSRGTLAGTVVALSNLNKAHVCDISLEARLNSAAVKLQSTQLVQSIRATIDAATEGFSTSPMVVQIKSAAASWAAKMKALKRILDDINEIFLEINLVLDAIRRIIAYIKALPYILLMMLADCLSKFINLLTNWLSDLAFGVSVYSEIKDAISSTYDVVVAAGETYVLAGATVKNAQDIVNQAGTSPNPRKVKRP